MMPAQAIAQALRAQLARPNAARITHNVNRKYLVYILAGIAVVPALWVVSRAISIRLHPVTHEDTIYRISQMQGWRLADAQLKDRIWTQLDSHQNISDADWQALTEAAEVETNGYVYDVSLLIMFGHHKIEDKFKSTIQKWAIRDMSQTNDPAAAMNGYFGYVRAGGTDDVEWAQRLEKRGPAYVEGIAKQKAAAEKVQKRIEAESASSQLP